MSIQMNPFAAVCVCLMVTAYGPEASAQEAGVTLVADGASSWQIVLPDTADPVMDYAAEELQHFLFEISGTKLPVIKSSEQAPPRTISLKYAPEDPRLHEDGVAILIDPAGERVVLSGQNARGVIYSVYTLLEDHLGVRFLAADCTTTPKSKSVILPAADYTHSPPFMYRETLYFDSFPRQISVRQRLNGPQSACDATTGGKWAFQPYVHSFCHLIPGEKYFEDHPEYFGLNAGVRNPEHIHGQICLTNPEVLALSKTTVLQWNEDHPDVPIYDVSQNDGNGWCECASCSALVDIEGSQHGPIMRFVNDIADTMKEKEPDKWIETLAYAYSTKPPAHATPRDNVIIRLCHAGCYFHGFEKCGLDAHLTDYLDAWSERTRRVFIWHYAANFAHYIAPNQNLRGLADDIRYYASHGVNGLMVQSNYQGSCGELSELRQYLSAQLMWDSSRSPDQIINEFCEGYYGPAAQQVLRYLALLDQAAEKPDVHAFGAWDPRQTVTPEMVLDGLTILAEAEAVAVDTPYRERVERLLLPLWYMQLSFGGAYLPDPGEASGLVDRFATITRRDNGTHINEGRLVEEWLKEMMARYAPAPEGLVYDLYTKLTEATLENTADWRSTLFESSVNPASEGHDALLPGGQRDQALEGPVPAIFHHPTAEGWGRASYAMDLPVVNPGETIELQFAAALSGDSRDGVTFAVLINDEQAWSETITDRHISSQNLDLTPWAGQKVTITLQVHPVGDSANDWANWLRPQILIVKP